MKTVALIYGGRSGEHEISIRSAESIKKALDGRYKIAEYFISKDGKWSPGPILPEPGANPGIDLVFPVLHGTFGEDGTIQGLLEMADLPYVSAGVVASAAGMDKDMAKRLMREAGLPVVEWYVADENSIPGDNPFGYPVFVKPANLGSSVGITKAWSDGELVRALENARQYDRKVMVERAIIGMEVECAVLGGEKPAASTPCEVLPSREFYDYEDKYVLDKTQFRIPPGLPHDTIEAIKRMSVRAFAAIGGEIMARVDFLIESPTGSAPGNIYINEINTIPGFTSISMYPRMWEQSGIAYPDLLDRLIDLALDRQERKKALKYSI